MKLQDILVIGALGYVTYLIVAKLNQPQPPPLPMATLFDTVTGLPVPEPADLQATIPALRV